MRVHGGVYPADEEGGHGGHPAQVATGPAKVFEPGYVGAPHVPVCLQREREGDVDVYALAYELMDGGDASRGGGYLDHGVGAVKQMEEPPCLVDGRIRIVGKVRADLQGRVAVGGVGLVVDRAKEVGGCPDVLDGQRFVYLVDAASAGRESLKGVVVVAALCDGLLEDGRVGGESRYTEIDEALQLSGLDEAAPDVVVPDRLADGPDVLNGVAHPAPPPQLVYW